MYASRPSRAARDGKRHEPLPPLPRGASGEKQQGREHAGKEVRHQPAVSSDDEIHQIPDDDDGGVAVQQDFCRHAAGRYTLSTVLERLPGVGEGETGGTVKGLAIAALIVRLAGCRRVDEEQHDNRSREAAAQQQRPPDSPLQEREQEERQRRGDVRRLREGDETEDHRRRVVGRRGAKEALEPAAAPACGSPRACRPRETPPRKRA